MLKNESLKLTTAQFAKLHKIKWWEWSEEKLKEEGNKFVSLQYLLGEED